MRFIKLRMAAFSKGEGERAIFRAARVNFPSGRIIMTKYDSIFVHF